MLVSHFILRFSPRKKILITPVISCVMDLRLLIKFGVEFRAVGHMPVTQYKCNFFANSQNFMGSRTLVLSAPPSPQSAIVAMSPIKRCNRWSKSRCRPLTQTNL